MVQKKNSDKISIANIISMIGIAALAVLTYLGVLYTGAALSVAIIVAAVIAALNFLLLWFMCKAKSAENYLSKWIIVEIATVVVYIGCAIGSTILCGIPQFFAVNADRDTIREYAISDTTKLSALFDRFNTFENEALGNYQNGLTNAAQAGAVWTDSLTNHIQTLDGFNRTDTHTIIHLVRAIECDEVYGEKYTDLSREKVKAINDIKNNVIEGLNPFTFPNVVGSIKEIAERAERELTEISQSVNLPIIENTQQPTNNSRTRRRAYIHKYDITGYQTSEFTIDGGIESLQLHTCTNGSQGFNIWGIIVAFAIHLVIIFNYLVIHRTRTLAVGTSNEEDGGRILK